MTKGATSLHESKYYYRSSYGKDSLGEIGYYKICWNYRWYSKDRGLDALACIVNIDGQSRYGLFPDDKPQSKSSYSLLSTYSRKIKVRKWEI